MHATVRHLPPALLVLSIVLGAASAAVAQPPPRVPWFHIHVHGSTCLRTDFMPFGGQICVDSVFDERDFFLYRSGAAEDIATNSRWVYGEPKVRVPLQTVVRRGAVPAAELVAIRQAVADSRLAIAPDSCDPAADDPRIGAHYEIVWYPPSTLSGRALDLSTDHPTPCPPGLMALVERVLSVAADLPVR
jgi:hypothetical protein